MVSIEQLIDDAKCYEMVQQAALAGWVRSPSGNADKIKERGHND